jgi:hypothetical protein
MRAAPLLLVATAAAIASSASSASAEDTHEEHPTLLDRPHTILEIEAGILALPTAPISPSSRGGSTPLGAIGNGDATVETGLHILYRPDRDWSFGAGALFAPHPTTDSDYGGASGLPRAHTRSYLFLGAEGRYFPLHTRWFDGWFGLDVGGLVIADRFSTESAPQVPSILGTNTVTVSTEGFAIGLQIGGDYLISDSFVLGLTLRADRWFLPSEKPFSQQTSCDPIGDCPTLTGSVAAFEASLTFGYRIPL